MNNLAETYLRQGRSFLYAGEPQRSVELFLKARAISPGDPMLMTAILKDLVGALNLCGRPDEASKYSMELQALTPPPLELPEESAPPPRQSKWFVYMAVSLCAACVIAITALTTWWYVHNKSGGASYPSISPVHATEAQEYAITGGNLSPRERLLRDDVGMVAVMGEYTGEINGHHVYWDHLIGWGSSIAFQSDGHILTNGHVIKLGESAPTTLAKMGYPSMSFQRIKYIVCYGPDAADRYEADANDVEVSSRLDLAMLHIPHQFSNPMQLDDQDIHQGDDIWAAGYPGGVDAFLNAENSALDRLRSLVAAGVASGSINELDAFDPGAFIPQLNKGIISASERIIKGVSYTEFDATVMHGNSGGPLLNAQNEVVGMVTLSLGGANPQYNGNNFAIRASEIEGEIPALHGN